MTDVVERLAAALADRYTIQRELGAGGMATVYLAHDRKLGRTVALKVLRPELAAALGSDRFLREIEIAAKLAHPHILALYDCGAAEGLLYYTMPFVEGESLRDRLARERQLSLDDALQITREVADALGYAHSLGLVHRDVKPENILFEAGHAVMSDFGIAKAIAAAGTARLTETGLAIGTPAYMSPEQAAGSQDVDGRSDIYSLGCVLYEMLVGETPYTGPSAQAILARKLSEPLPRISVVREAVPPGVEAALNKALARTPPDRWRTAAQFADGLAHPETVVATPSGVAAQARRAEGWSRLPRWSRWAASAVVAVAVVALAAVQILRPKPLVIAAANLTPVTSEPGVEWQPAISPDGKQVAYVAGPTLSAGRLFVRSAANLSGSATLRLGDTTAGGQMSPAWTADGQYVRYINCTSDNESCAWKETAGMGGAVRPVPRPRGNRFFMSWSPDGTRVAYFRYDTLFTASAAATDERRVTVHGTADISSHSPAWSPDGKRIAFVAGNAGWVFSGNLQGSSIWVVDAAGGSASQIVSDSCLNASPAWLDAQHLLFVSNRDGPVRGVYEVEVGPAGRRGTPRAIPGIADPHSISYSPVARRLAFSRFTHRQNIWSYPLNAPRPLSTSDGQRVTDGNEAIEEHDVSPDGKWIAYSSNLRGSSDLYKRPLAGGTPVAITATPATDEWGPMWSPDGREIAFYASLPSGGVGVFVMSSEGGAPTRLSNGPDSTIAQDPRWQRDGLGLSYWSSWSDGRPGLHVWLASRERVDGPWRHPVQLDDSLDVTGSRPVAPAWAPDGSGFVSTAGLAGVAIRAVVGADGHVTRHAWPAASSLRLLWHSLRYSADGSTVYGVGSHRDGRVGVWAVPVGRGAPRLVVRLNDPAVEATGRMSLGPDRVYLTVTQIESDIWVADLRW